MARYQRLEPKARSRIKQILEDEGIIDVEEGMAIVRPHLLFDAAEAREREVRRVTHGIIASMRDPLGVRRCFATDHGDFVNVEKTNDIDALNDVERQLSKKYAGLYPGLAKVTKRRNELAGLESTSMAD